MPRYFTLDEANALIPELTEILTELRTLRPLVVENRGQVNQIQRQARRNGHNLPAIDLWALRTEAEQAATRINELIARVQEMGAQVKDLDMGLVDFPAQREGREILLCWRLGEDRIRFFHDLESGFAGRQPL